MELNKQPPIDFSTSMFQNRFISMFSGVAVKENDHYIMIENISGRTLVNRITKQWKSSVISNFLFSKVTHRLVIFRKFFAVEVLYILEQLQQDRYITHADRALFRKAIELLKENTWLKNALSTDVKNRLDYTQLNLFKKTPLPMQKEFLNLYDHNTQLYGLNGFLLSASPGAGKTLTSLMLMACLKKDLTIIVCLKNTVLDPWVKTLETEFKKPVKFWSTLTHKTLDSIDYDYIVVHYEAIQTLFDFLPKLKQKNIGIILDECHNFNEIKSERTQKFIQLVKESGAIDVLPMSGTPVKAMATEMVPMLTAIDPLFEDDVSFRFKKIFGISTARANDIMRNRVGLISYRTEKSSEEYGDLEEINYKVELPNADRYTISTIKKEMTIFVTERLEFYKSNFKKYEEMYQKGLIEFEKSVLTDSDKSAYDKYKKQIKAIRQATGLFDVHKEMQDANLYEKKVIAPKLSGSTLHEWRDAKSVVKYVGLKVRGEALGRLLGKRRAECHVDMIKHAQLESFVEAATKKTLIFTSYVDVVNEIAEYFKDPIFKNRYDPLAVTGETTKNLKQILGRLENDPKAGPIIATYDSLSTGVPVTSASTVILFNQPFRSYEREQAVARAWRKGQDTPVTVVNIILDTGNSPNISTRSMDIMEWSKEQVEQITGVKLGGSKSNPDNPDIGIEQYIDDVEKTHWVAQMTDLDVHGKAIALNQILDGSDAINEEQMLTDIIPSLEGMFDSAVRTIKKIFTVIDGKDIDKERVSPYVMSKKTLDVIRSKPYHELADLFVVRPEGLNVTYLKFSDEMIYQFETLHSFFETVLTPVTQYLAVLASDPKQIGSIRPGEFNLYLKNYDLDAIKQRYSSNFKDGNLSKAYYHQMIARNEDWVKLARSLTSAQAAYLQISPEKVERSVNNIYDILEEIIVRLKTDQELLKLSKVQLKDLTTLAYTLASAVEYYSVLLFSWRVFNQSLKETDKDLSTL